MKDNYTDVTFILDRSGSMQSIWSDAAGGLKQFIEDQKKVPGDMLFSLVLFNHGYETRHRAVPLDQVKPLDTGDGPQGQTALLDAIGKTINDVGQRLSAMPEDQKPSKVIVAIMTDGEENDSRTFNRHQISDMIRDQKDIWKWEFLFLAANQDAIASAAALNINASSALNFAPSGVGVRSMLHSVSKSIGISRTGGSGGFSTTGSSKGN